MSKPHVTQALQQDEGSGSDFLYDPHAWAGNMRINLSAITFMPHHDPKTGAIWGSLLFDNSRGNESKALQVLLRVDDMVAFARSIVTEYGKVQDLRTVVSDFLASNEDVPNMGDQELMFMSDALVSLLEDSYE